MTLPKVPVDPDLAHYVQAGELSRETAMLITTTRAVNGTRKAIEELTENVGSTQKKILDLERKLTGDVNSDDSPEAYELDFGDG